MLAGSANRISERIFVVLTFKMDATWYCHNKIHQSYCIHSLNPLCGYHSPIELSRIVENFEKHMHRNVAVANVLTFYGFFAESCQKYASIFKILRLFTIERWRMALLHLEKGASNAAHSTSSNTVDSSCHVYSCRPFQCAFTWYYWVFGIVEQNIRQNHAESKMCN